MAITRITHQRSLQGLFYMSMWLLLPAMFAILLLPRDDSYEIGSGMAILALIGVYTVCFAVVYYHQSRILQVIQARSEKLTLLGMKNSLEENKNNLYFTASCLAEPEKDRVKFFKNIVRGETWAYADFDCEYLAHTKYGTYRAKSVYYSVMTTALPRGMPHMFFDSAKARNRQFKMFFRQAQAQSLEGNFDQHFTTYFPAEYQIDGRALISPEVMQALLDADDYDIEIAGNQIFLYGDLLELEPQMEDMQKKIAVIRDKIMHNAPTYRDEALPYAEGRKSVSSLGGELAINLTKAYGMIVFGLGLTAVSALFVFGLHFLNNLTLYAFIAGVSMVASNGLKIYREQKRRKSLMMAYRYGKSLNDQPGAPH